MKPNLLPFSNYIRNLSNFHPRRLAAAVCALGCAVLPLRTIALAGVLALGSAGVDAATFSADFDNGAMPAGSAVFGHAVVEATGGVGNSGCLKLTKATNSQNGSFIVNDLDSGRLVNSFTVRLRVRVGGGTATPADGFSINFANDLPNTAFAGGGEEGAGSGITVAFDSFNNGGGEAPAIDVKWCGSTISHVLTSISQGPSGTSFHDVLVKADPDGTVDVSYNNVVIYTNLQTPWRGVVGGRLGLGARTGGFTDNHFVDNLVLTTTLAPMIITAAPADAHLLAGKTAVFAVGVNDPAHAAYQWQRQGPGEVAFTDVPGATAACITLPNVSPGDSGSRFRVVVTGPDNSILSGDGELTVGDGLRRNLDFNSGLPANTAVYGSSFVDASGGVGNSGVLKLTAAVNGQNGAFVINDFTGGQLVQGFSASFRLRLGGGSVPPADGVSFNWGTNLPNGTYPFPEEVSEPNGGLSVRFDLYNNGFCEAPAIDVVWNQLMVAQRFLPIAELETGNGFADVFVQVKTNGTVDVTYGCRQICTDVSLPGFNGFRGARFGLAGRTGGFNENQFVDDLSITPKLCVSITCPPNQVLWTCSNSAPASFNAAASGSCGGNTTVTCTPASGSQFLVGTNTVICRASDGLGHSNSCSFTVTVVRDTSPPAISCPPDQTAFTPGNSTPVSYCAIATDDCDTNVAVTCTPSSGSLFSIGSTMVTCIATDDGGNTANCNFTVTVVERAGETVVVIVTNTTGRAASDLHVTFTGADGNLYVDPLTVMASGCGVPMVPSNGAVTDTAVIDWGGACVSPDAAVVFTARSINGPLAVAGGFWSFGSTNLGLVAGASAHSLPASPSPFVAIKVERKCVPTAPATYSPWYPIGESFGLQQCFARWCCVPEVKYYCRIFYCPFPSRLARFLEGACVPVTGWIPDGSSPAEYAWQFRWQETEHHGPPADRPNTPTEHHPWRWGLDARYSDDGAVTFRQGADLASAFYAMRGALEITSDTVDPRFSFEEMLRRMAPGYQQSAQALTPVIVEMNEVLNQEANAALEAMKTDLEQLQSSLSNLSANFAIGSVSALPLADASGALRDMAAQIVNLPSSRFGNASSNLLVMAEAFDTAFQAVTRGLNLESNRQMFSWALLVRFRLMLDHFAAGSLPHLRIRVDLGNWVWVPYTLEDVRVKIADGTTGELLDDQIVPFSDLSEFDVRLLDVEPGRPLRIWFKIGSHLSRVIATTAQDGLRLGPLAVVPGDADGDNCIDSADRIAVQADQGAGGLTAAAVPSTDVNGDGVVNSTDLNIVQSNLGRCGEALPMSPLILVQPQSQTVTCGSTAGFSVTVTGMPPLVLQWQFNGFDVPGATNDQIIINNASPADSGTLSVRISNAAGTIRSDDVRLTVVDPVPARLRIDRQGGEVVLSWPQSCTDYQLEQTPALSVPISWIPSGAIPLSAGNQYRVSIPMTGDGQFFRLRQKYGDLVQQFIVGDSLGFPLPLEHGVTVDTRGLPEPCRNIPLSFDLDYGFYFLAFRRTHFPQLLTWEIIDYHVHAKPITFAGTLFGDAHFYLDPEKSSTGVLNVSTGQGEGTQHLLMASDFLGAMGFGLVPVEIHTHARFTFPSNGIVCVAISHCEANVPTEVPILGGAPLTASCAGCSQEKPIPPKPKLKITKAGRRTEYKYPDPSNSTNPPVQRRIGANAAENVFGKDFYYYYGFEVSYPAGTAECPNKHEQSVKSTATGGGTEARKPPKTGNDPGGFDSKNWGADSPTTQSNDDGTKSYWDGPGVGVNRNEHPATRKAKFRIRLLDWQGNELDCQEMEQTIEVDANGTVTKNEMTDPVPCKK